MGKRLRYNIQGKKRPGIAPKRMHTPRSTPREETQEERLSCNQIERIFESLLDGIVFCDQEGKIIWFNAAALKIFEVPTLSRWKGRSYQQFLQEYEMRDEQQQPIALESLLVTDDEAASRMPEKIVMLHLPSGRKVYVNLWYSPMFDSEGHAIGAITVFHGITHRNQKALHLQRVHEAVSTLTDASAHMPEHINLATFEEMSLLSPPVSYIAQQLVDVIHQVLDCHRVNILARGPTGHMYYVVGSGFTAEQERYWRAMGGHFHPSEFIDETVYERLSANQEIILTYDRLRKPPLFPSAIGSEKALLIPLFLEQRWVGTLNIIKAGPDSGYTAEEVELVKAVAALTVLIIEGLRCLHEQVETQTRELVQQEIYRLGNDFLTLASHELLTPLTVIIGNIQLAQRRLEALKRQVMEQSERVREQIEHVQYPLASASQGTYVQKRMIHDMLDDVRIQTKNLHLNMKCSDLLPLLKDAVTSQQRSAPEHVIVLKILPTEQSVPILADAERIIQVLNIYLTNALKYSPIEYPVTVRLVVADCVAMVSVRDEGPGIPAEEQELLWERFYRAKGSAVQHELDLSLGLSFYLCRAFIEHHHGRVGVQSDPGHGETFWFTLPVVAFPGE